MSKRRNKPDDLLKLMTAFEQLAAVLKDTYVPLFASHYKSLVKAGLPKDVALQLTVNLQSELLKNQLWGGGDEQVPGDGWKRGAES